MRDSSNSLDMEYHFVTINLYVPCLIEMRRYDAIKEKS